MSTSTSQKTLSRIAANRLQKELAEWQLNPPAGFKHRVTDNLQRWIIEVTGAPGTLYANEQYQLQVDFPEHYPMEAPQIIAIDVRLLPEDIVIFVQSPPLHPHIYSNGHICLGASFVFKFGIVGSHTFSDVSDILYDSWSPAMTARPPDNDRYVKNCRNGRSPKETRWWFHDDTV